MIRAQLLLALGHLSEAEKALEEGRHLAPRDGRFEDALAAVNERAGHAEAALAHERAATTLSPFVIDFARHRVQLVIQLHEWSDIDDALDHLKVALRQNGQNVTEVHLTAGQVQESHGNLARALSEYRTAAALDASNPAVWNAVAHAAEARGDLHASAEAYRRVLALRPDDGDAQQALIRAEKAQDDAKLRQLLPSH